MQFGPHSDLRPGAATYRMNSDKNTEEKSIIKQEWRHCLSRDGHISADNIFPWFSKGNYIYIYIYAYAYMYMHTCTCVNACMHTYIHA